MSIISVVHVPEGIAMAADSRLTGHRIYENNQIEKFTSSDNFQKIVLLSKSPVGISWAGDAFLNGNAVSHFISTFETENVHENDSVTQIATALKDRLRQESPEAKTMFYITGYRNSVPHIYLLTKDEFTLINQNENGLVYSSFIGGETEPIVKLLYGDKPAEINYRVMPLKDALDLSEFLVELVIDYQRFSNKLATCGGFVDVLVLTKDYAKFIKHKVLNSE